jgi:hypothetical protein
MSYTIASPVQLNDTLDVSGTTTIADKVIINTDGTIKPYAANTNINIQRHASSGTSAYDGKIGDVHFQFKSILTSNTSPLWSGVHIKRLAIGNVVYDTDGTFTTSPPFTMYESTISSSSKKSLVIDTDGGFTNIISNNSSNSTGDGFIMKSGTISESDLVGKLTVSTSNFLGSSSGYLQANYSIFGAYYVGAGGFVTTSDQRTKTDITVVDDGWALQKVRNIECKEYHYVDPKVKNNVKTIGFIAQEVEEQLPGAVNTITYFVPDELRDIFFVTITNLPDGKVKVKLPPINWSPEHTHRIKAYGKMDGEEETEITEFVDEENCIVIEKAYTHFHLYGKEVNNFKQLDKSKIFALHHSAIQQLDRNQQEDDQSIIALQEENALLKTQMADVLARLQAAGL